MCYQRPVGKPRLSSLLVATFAFALALLPRAGNAMRLDCYGLDSLCYMAQQIVEGRLGKSYTLDHLDVTEVTITSVHKGTLTVGDTVKFTELFLYRQPEPRGVPGNTVGLEPGEQAILFLARATRELSFFNLPADQPVYVPIRSGVKLVRDGKVFGSCQYSPPGPYVLEDEGRAAGSAPTLEAFRQQLKETIQRMNELAAQFAAAREAADGQWLLEMLRRRASDQAPGYVRDHIAEVACDGLANLRDPELLDQALQLSPLYWHESFSLRRGFGTQGGREYILHTIADPAVPIARKLPLARAIQEAGWVYRSWLDVPALAPNPGPSGPDNGRYIARIAELVVANRDNEELSSILVQDINYFARGIVQGEKDATYTDLIEALKLLEQTYRASQSERLRFEIEDATANGDRASYDRLGSPCGPVISILSQPPPGQFAASPEPCVHFGYSYRVLDKGYYQAAVVLQNQKSGEKHVIAVPVTVHGETPGSGEAGGCRVALPPALAHGRYRAYLQFTRDNRVVSAGHYCEVDL